MNEAIEVIRLVWSILGPVATAMVEKAMSGADPRDVLRDESIAQILPAQSHTEAAMLAAIAAKRGAQS